MPRKATGSYYKSGELWYASVTLGAGSKGRKSIPLPAAKSEEQAAVRTALVNELAQKLRAAGLVGDAQRFLIEAGSREGKPLERVRRAVDALSKGELSPKRVALGDATFAEVAKMWTSGDLARDYKDHVKAKVLGNQDARKMELHIDPVVGHVRIKEFTLEHGEAVLAALPAALGNGSRRNVAKLVVRVLHLCVYPLKIIGHNPLPRGFVPKEAPDKAKGCVYPDEDALLLGCADVWIGWRVYDGFKHREGMRDDEAKRCTWTDFDLVRGGVNLDKNKTRDPRAWALNPSVTRTIAAWRLYRESIEGPLPDDGLVFVSPKGTRIGVNDAKRYRRHLERAGVDRAALFQHDESRQRIRSHDMRSTFITSSLANGRTETWVQDRTGHRDSRMVNKYRRTARTFAELGLGDLRPMAELIPELAPFLAKLPAAGARGQAERSEQGAGQRVGGPASPSGEPAAAAAAGAAVGGAAEHEPTPRPLARVAQPMSARHDAGTGIVAGIVANHSSGGLGRTPGMRGFINGFDGFTLSACLATIQPSQTTARRRSRSSTNGSRCARDSTPTRSS